MLFRSRPVIVPVCLLALLLGAPAMAQPQPDSPREILRDLQHYVLINQREAAEAKAQQLLDLGLSPRQLLDLVKSSRDVDRFISVLDRMQTTPQLEDVGAQLRQAYRRGERELVRDPDEIARNIRLLTGQAKARLLAQNALVAAGEYAVPQLLDALLGQDERLASEAGRVLVQMERQAIIPLCTALLDVTPVNQEKIINVVSRIAYRTSLPFLKELEENSDVAMVRREASAAVERIGGSGVPFASDLYEELADGYYGQRTDLTSFEGEDVQLLWNYDERRGLWAQAIRTGLFHEAMAMSMAERAMSLNPRSRQALSMWVLANLRRDIETPDGYVNPAYSEDMRDAQYYAVAAGAEICQPVLARALSDRNTRLVRSAIAALDLTAGGQSLWSYGGGPAPLLGALRYQNRRVQYESALALGKANPDSTFQGAERVVPILASTIRGAAEKYAVLIERGVGTEGQRRGILSSMGYTVLPSGDTLQEIASAIAEAPGIDLIIVDLASVEAAREVIEQARGNALLAATPVLVLTSSQGSIDLQAEFRRDETVSVRSRGIPEDMFRAAADQLVERASGGPISEGEARDYQARALGVLRDIAIARGPVFKAEDAVAPLIRGLQDEASPFKLLIAEVLAHIGEDRAQIALMDATMAASGGERVAMLQKVADSAKRFGNRLEPRHLTSLSSMATSGEASEATAAAAVMGSLNLSNEGLVPLILEAR